MLVIVDIRDGGRDVKVRYVTCGDWNPRSEAPRAWDSGRRCGTSGRTARGL